jgi:hypothetical protein
MLLISNALLILARYRVLGLEILTELVYDCSVVYNPLNYTGSHLNSGPFIWDQLLLMGVRIEEIRLV